MGRSCDHTPRGVACDDAGGRARHPPARRGSALCVSDHAGGAGNRWLALRRHRHQIVAREEFGEPTQSPCEVVSVEVGQIMLAAFMEGAQPRALAEGVTDLPHLGDIAPHGHGLGQAAGA